MNKRELEEFERVIDKYQEGLFRFAFFRTGSMDDSRDIVQNVFVRLYNRRGGFAAIENIKSFLYRSISNACSDYYRRKRSMRTVSLEHAVTEAGEDPDEEARMEYERITSLVDILPREQAEIIRMRTVNSLTFCEIADILQIPVTTAKSRFKYGIDKLRSNLKG